MKKNLVIYIPAIIAVVVIKMYYRTADSEQLFWILAPTTKWVQILSGISFEKIVQVGYVSHEYRFIIAPSCSGVRFLLIAFIMMVFAFTSIMDSLRKKIYWLGFSAIFSYIATIFVNGIRITVSIYLPLFLADRKILPTWITAEQLHTVIGTTVYFSMLFAVYYLAGRLCKTVQKSAAKRFLVPVFWYFTMVLGIPAIGRLYRGDWTGFWQYTMLVTGVCVLIVLSFWLIGRVRAFLADWAAPFQK